jgi:hypothetical protein
MMPREEVISPTPAAPAAGRGASTTRSRSAHLRARPWSEACLVSWTGISRGSIAGGELSALRHLCVVRGDMRDRLRRRGSVFGQFIYQRRYI